MKKQYQEIDHAVKVRADNLKLLKIENKKQQEYHDQQIRELKELARQGNLQMSDVTAAGLGGGGDQAQEIERLK